MNKHRQAPRLSLVGILIIAIALIVASSACQRRVEGESYFQTEDGPKIIFRGGYGNIVIRYQPPPEPIFKVGNATRYLDFNELYEKYGVIDQPLVISYQVRTSVMSTTIDRNTLSPTFDQEVDAIIRSWTYTRWGGGRLRVRVEMARSRITVDLRNTSLADRVPNMKMPDYGEAKDMVAAHGFTVVLGNIN